MCSLLLFCKHTPQNIISWTHAILENNNLSVIY